jgi:hypothetical protein
MTDTGTKRPGRNEPCHCGSGKKYKHCCLDKDEEAERAARAAQQVSADQPTPPAEDEPAPHATPRPRPADQPWKHTARPDRSSRRINTPRKAG